MEKININWKKIHEANPKGMREWVGSFYTAFKITKMAVGGVGITITGASGSIRNFTASELNAKALNLIFWFDAKGIHVDASWDFSGDLQWVCYVYKISDGKYYHIDHDVKDRQTALAEGIESAFELLK